ncbi:hypothetical protein BC940DRAFT_316024 [Gongronella butleri]|nr:hypothetical protein BC940DRAFT_316024 [Gongronella butleri]
MAAEPPTPTSSTSTTAPVLRINDHHRHVSSSASSTSSTSSTSSGSGSGDDASPMSAYPVFDAYTTNSRKNDDIGGQATLSLQERRQRNKTASARYRAKKNQQHQDMRSMIHSLTKENDVLMRQLDHVMGENQQLKINCDKLRGKIMAEKMLKKLLQQQLCTHPNAAAADMVLDDDENDELADDCAEMDVNQEHYTTRPKTPENAPNDNHVSFKANHDLPTRHDHGPT